MKMKLTIKEVVIEFEEPDTLTTTGPKLEPGEKIVLPFPFNFGSLAADKPTPPKKKGKKPC